MSLREDGGTGSRDWSREGDASKFTPMRLGKSFPTTLLREDDSGRETDSRSLRASVENILFNETNFPAENMRRDGKKSRNEL